MRQKSRVMHGFMRNAQYFKATFLMLQFIKLANRLHFFNAKTGIRKMFCHQINRSKALSSFSSCDWLYVLQSIGTCVY